MNASTLARDRRSAQVAVAAVACRGGERDHLLRLVELDRVVVWLTALVRGTDGIDGQAERVGAHCVLEDRREHLAVLVHSAGPIDGSASRRATKRAMSMLAIAASGRTRA